MKFAEIPGRLNQLLFPPDPIMISHTITVEGPEQKKTERYDIDVEVDDNLKVRLDASIILNEYMTLFCLYYK